ncbi:MAG: DUF937 domain-containing protein [Chitinophagaceae bacterium]|nr:DUF937 domain-containing protein [Chitinophagaceae bacterium]
MSFNLIDAAKNLFTDELVKKASNYLNESESGVVKAIASILPVVLSGFVNKVANHEGADFVAQTAKQQNESGVLSNLESFFGNDGGSLLNKGAGLVNSLFGNKLDGITGLLSNFTGLKNASVSSLMSMAAPAIMGLLGKHASDNNLNTGSITTLLNNQKSAINAALPSGLNLSSVLGNFGGIENTIAQHTHQQSGTADKKGNAMRYILPVILFALLAMASYYFKGCNKNPEMITTTAESSSTKHESGEIKKTTVNITGKIDSLTGDFIYNTGNMVSIDLPNNAGKLEVGEFSTENKLYKFLTDANAKLDTVKGNWFEFTNVRFKTGSSEITEASLAQLKNMVAITKGFPSAQFKIGGYTDNTGSEATNIALSQKRANAVVAELKKLGASANSINDAKGYGPQWPIADNTTAEGRAQNRRVAVNVKAK